MPLITNRTTRIPTFDYFKVIKAPPSGVLAVKVIDDNTLESNNLYKKLFQFRYRFVYGDEEKSVWSAISLIPYPSKTSDVNFNALNNVQNVIEIKIPTGNSYVHKIEVAGRVNLENVWSDFFLVDTLDKKRDYINNDSIYTYLFKNDGVYPPIDLDESNLLFDYVPDNANALELANGNTIVVGGLKDGYNRDTELDMAIIGGFNRSSSSTLSTLSASARNKDDNGDWGAISSGDNWNTPYSEYKLGIIKFTGSPTPGDIITINIRGYTTEKWSDTAWTGDKFTDLDFNDSFTVIVQPNWSTNTIVNAFVNHVNNGKSSTWNYTGRRAKPSKPFLNSSSGNILNFGAQNIGPGQDYRRYKYESVQVNVIKAFSFSQADIIPTYKWSGIYKFGIVYYDKDGKTNGVFTNDELKLRTGNYKTNYIWTDKGSTNIFPENETCEIYIKHDPPSWASYYHIVRTEELSCDFSLMAIAGKALYQNSYLFLVIENFKDTNEKAKESAGVISYDSTKFVEGDRVRIMYKYVTTTLGLGVDWDSKKALDLPILSVEEIDVPATPLPGTTKVLAIKVNDVRSGINTNDVYSPAANDACMIEIYRPAKVLADEDLVYYEVGRKYNILTDSNGNKYHNGDDIVTGIPARRFIFDNEAGMEFIHGTPEKIEVTYPIDISGFQKGDTITVSGTSLNNGIFTLSAAPTQSPNGIVTTFFVNEPVVNEVLQTAGIGAKGVIITKVVYYNDRYTYINMIGDGDYYYKQRFMLHAYNTIGANLVPINIVDKNFSDFYKSAVWGQGRPLVVDESIKEEYYPAMLRFSGSYIQGTNINKTNRFFPLNFEEADVSFGDILRLKTRENFIRVFQRNKVGMIPIYRSIIIDNANSTQVALSEKLLSKPNYYSGEYGIDKYGSSLVSTDYGDYFLDTLNKAIVRVSLDGITNISDTNNLATWANDNMDEDSYGYGCFNYENRCVVMLVGKIQYFGYNNNILVPWTISNKIVAYSEQDKKFISFYGFTDAESMFFANGFIYSFKGKVYIHDKISSSNDFYNVLQRSVIIFVSNGSVQLKKTYTAIEMLSDKLWTGTLKTGPLTNQETTIEGDDFVSIYGISARFNKENKFNGTIKRDINSPGGRLFGDTMKGCYAVVEIGITGGVNIIDTRLISVSLKYIQSPITNM